MATFAELPVFGPSCPHDHRAERGGPCAQDHLCCKRGCKTVCNTGVVCHWCGRLYTRCEAHGGFPGAKRSLHSHAALSHSRGR